MNAIRRLWCKLFGHDYCLAVVDGGGVAVECACCGNRMIERTVKRQKNHSNSTAALATTEPKP